MQAQDIISFWFKEITPEQWFKKDLAFDQMITKRFSKTLQQAKDGEFWQWRTTLQGRLAEIIVLDQFSRNIHREDARSFAQDPMALALAQEAVLAEKDTNLAPLSTQEKSFLYMPYMHSESLIIHEQAEKLFSIPGLEYNLDFERRHKVIIEKFGRYPHRNKILGRISTPAEIEFLRQPGSGF